MILSPGPTLCLISAPEFRLQDSISPYAVLHLDRASVQNPSMQVVYCWVQQYGSSWTRSQMPQTPEDPLLPGKPPWSRVVTAHKVNGHARLGVRRYFPFQVGLRRGSTYGHSQLWDNNPSDWNVCVVYILFSPQQNYILGTVLGMKGNRLNSGLNMGRWAPIRTIFSHPTVRHNTVVEYLSVIMWRTGSRPGTGSGDLSFPSMCWVSWIPPPGTS